MNRFGCSDIEIDEPNLNATPKFLYGSEHLEVTADPGLAIPQTHYNDVNNQVVTIASEFLPTAAVISVARLPISSTYSKK